MKYLYLILLAIILTTSGHAGDKSSYRKAIIGINYLADIDVGDPLRFEPGFNLEGGWRLLGRESSNGKSSSSTTETDIYLKPGFSYFKRANYYTGLVISSGLCLRTTFKRGVFFEINATPGYMHKIYNADVYDYSNGSFSKSRASDPNLFLGGDINMGIDFSKKKETSGIGLIGGAGFFWRFPNNSSWVRHQYLKLGLTFTVRTKR